LLWVSAALLALLFGTAAYAASVLTGEESAVTIEEAALRSGPNGDEIVVQVNVSGKANNPSCYLRGGSSWTESTWPDADLTELRVLGDTAIYTYFRDRNPKGQTVDSEQTPLFAYCAAGTGTGGGGPSFRSDESHVQGTAAPGTAPAETERRLVRKDMASRAIEPPVATLSFGGRSAEGSPGPYCWTPGERDEDENALWCWHKTERPVPEASEALRVPAGSTMSLKFGSEADLDSVVPLTQRLSGETPVGNTWGGTRPEILEATEQADGRYVVPVPAATTPGEYLVSVDVAGPVGEARYSFRVSVAEGN
jgi:hypothetical protein